MARIRVAFAVLLAIGLACTSQQEQVRRARADLRDAVAARDPEATTEALARLIAGGGARDAPETVRDATALLVRMGEAPWALWVLEDAVRRFPEREELRLVFAQVALLVGEAARARAALQPLDSESILHPHALVLRARAMLALGERSAAFDLLEQAERLYPGLPAPHLLRIRLLLEERRLDEAREVVADARRRLTSAGDLRTLDVLAAEIEAARGDAEAAAASLRRAVERDPENAAAWSALLRVLARADRLEVAVELLRAALGEDPERRSLYPALAGVLRRLGRPREAEAVLRRYVAVSSSPMAPLALARFELERGDLAGMSEVLDEARARFPEEPLLELVRVEVLIERGRLDAARRRLAGLAERVGDRPHLEYLEARLALAAGDPAAAAEKLRHLAPRFDRAETQLWLGRALEALGDLRGAQRRYGLARQRDPSSPTASLEMLRVAQKLGAPRSMIEPARWLLRVPDHRATGYTALAEALLELDRFAEAEELARRFAAEHPGEMNARILLFRALWRQDRGDEAARVLEEARARFGPGPELAVERARLLGTTGRVDEAIALLESALEDGPDDADLLRVLASLYFEKDDFERGSELVDRALALQPDDLLPLRLRVHYAAARGPLEVARRDGERYLERRPDDAEVHHMLGTTYERLGLTQRALGAYRRAAALDDWAVEPRRHLALLLATRGDLAGALEAAQEAYALAPSDAEVLDALGWIYLQHGLVERSISLLEEAAAAAPGRARTQLHLGLAYREAERPDEARRLLSRLVAGADSDGEVRERAQAALRALR